MKKNYLLYSFVRVIILFTIVSLISGDKEFSELENRKLKTNVKFTIKNFLDGSFQEDYESYINDQFPLRDNWISLKSMNEYILGKIENNGIIYGNDEELFEKFDSLDEEKLKNNVGAINNFAETYYDKVSLMIIPSSYEIYKENLPMGSPIILQEELINKIYNFSTFSNNIDVMKELLDNKNSYIYYKTDHHWTTYGAYLAYCKFIDSINGNKVNLENFKEVELSNFYGTYYSKAKPFNIEPDIMTYYDFNNLTMEIVGDKIYDSIYDYSKETLRDKYSLFLYGNNPLTIIKNKDIKNNKKILVIKDSFGNSLVPFLTQNYEEVHVIDLRHFSSKLSSYLQENDFEDILIVYNFINLATDNNVLRIKY
ncbi:DHHW family protein [Clostridium sp.]|uniref:DHHW family protein n=1 Tax=Clostridium sp. TaxID=1506 RepID=UPI00262A4E6A|nr:DHHW family protein [Clostridium sp.]